MWILLVTLFSLIGTAVTASKPAPSNAMESRRLSAVVRQYERHLGLKAPILVFVVEKNERLASVRASEIRPGTYLLELDRNFLATLTEEEQRAVIAHEVGHVWIFTHHPYIQSEPLANEKARTLVSEASLRSIYEKVWTVDGQHGNFQEYLDRTLDLAQAPPAAAPSEISTLH